MCAFCMVSSSPRPILWHIPAVFEMSSKEDNREAVPRQLFAALQHEVDRENDVGRFWEELTWKELGAAGVYFGGEWGADATSSSDCDENASSGCEADDEL